MSDKRNLDLTKPVMTNSGHLVTLLKTDVKDKIYTVVGIIHYASGLVERSESWTADGRVHSGAAENYVGNLVNVPEARPVNVWIILWDDGRVTTTFSRPLYRHGVFAVHPVNVSLKRGEGFPE